MTLSAETTSNAARTSYPTALRPLRIGTVELGNRIVFPAVQTNYANPDGTVSDKLRDFYLALARGGCGLVITGAAVVSAESVAFDRVMRVDSDCVMSALTALFRDIEAAGSVPGVQLIHYGRQAMPSVTGHDLLPPSPVPCPVMSQLDPSYRVLGMTLDDIERVRGDFTRAAVRAAEAGARVVEVHAAHGYLLNEFLSPYSNHRDDAYGGSAENRVRLVAEIVAGIRRRLGSGVVISVRISGDEYVDGGLTPADHAVTIPDLEGAGMDVLSVSAGVYQSMERIVPPLALGKTPHLQLATALKGSASVPVIAVGSVLSMATAESIVASGRADLVAMARAQIADPEIVAKAAAGRDRDTRRCTGCNECTFWTRGDPQMLCTVNPDLRNEAA
jgi:2,4-dienoyl-CoA reductase-like NADH-dependent reductase (Old Yellow Enzyme family)